MMRLSVLLLVPFLISSSRAAISKYIPEFLEKVNASTRPMGTLDSPFKMRISIELDETEFNFATRRLKIQATAHFRWRDERLRFDTADAHGKTSIHLSSDVFFHVTYGSVKIWVPMAKMNYDYDYRSKKELTIDSFGNLVLTVRYSTDYGCTYEKGTYPDDTYRCYFRYEHIYNNMTNVVENMHGGKAGYLKLNPEYRHAPNHAITNLSSWPSNVDGWFYSEDYYPRINFEVWVQRRAATLVERVIIPAWCLVALDVIFFVMGQGVWTGVVILPVYITYFETFRLLIRDAAGNLPPFVRVIYSRLLSCFACNLLRLAAFLVRKELPEHPFGYAFDTPLRKLAMLVALSAFFYIVL